MKATRTDLGLLLIKPDIYHDDRGFFTESYNYAQFNKELRRLDYPIIDFDQDNHSVSHEGVFRGFHYQVPPYAQSKLIWCSSGKITDIAIDIRPNSDTFGQAEVFDLSEDNHLQLFIPKGFAHGFLAITEGAKIHYKCDGYYMPGYEGGINPNEAFKYIHPDNWIISDKDRSLPVFGKHRRFV